MNNKSIKKYKIKFEKVFLKKMDEMMCFAKINNRTG